MTVFEGPYGRCRCTECGVDAWREGTGQWYHSIVADHCDTWSHNWERYDWLAERDAANAAADRRERRRELVSLARHPARTLRRTFTRTQAAPAQK